LTVTAKKGGDAADDEYELVVPRFAGIVDLPPKLGRQLHAGEFAHVGLPSTGSETVAEALHWRIQNWVDKKLKAARARWKEG
jgi:hypothetical protein